ncbi:MAG: PRK06851 family protein [Thermoanaerobacteraceae bacterium]|nr:PRK06851 family protein [Thermoanaerobacteraceae bacterium]
MVKRVFPGGNTAYGFYSFYDYIIEPDATRIMIIKGGPGVGKSTFMKKIGDELMNRGFDVEFHHCSGDNNSIDGLVIPSIKVAMIDGTAPHIVDPKNPGAVDEIIHLGDYWDEKGMREVKEEIIRANKEVGRLFRKGYSYLAALNSVINDFININNSLMDFSKIDRVTLELMDHIKGQLDKQGKVRHLFGSAITPEGVVDYLETVVGPMEDIYVIKGEPGTGKSTLLKRLTEIVLMRGYYVEVYHDHLNPDKYAHVVIPEINTAFTTSDKFEKQAVKTYDFNVYMNKGQYEEKAEDEVIMDILLKKAVKYINKAKKTHDYMETFYIPNMHFEQINEVRENTLNRILKYVGEFEG